MDFSAEILDPPSERTETTAATTHTTLTADIDRKIPEPVFSNI